MIYNLRWNFTVLFDVFRKFLVSEVCKIIIKWVVSIHMEPKIDESQTSSYSLCLSIKKEKAL